MDTEKYTPIKTVQISNAGCQRIDNNGRRISERRKPPGIRCRIEAGILCLRITATFQ